MRLPVRWSPTRALLLGLVLTLATVVAYSWYVDGQIRGLERLQTDLADRNRREALQLIRIQNDLNQLGLAMRDMLDRDAPYPLQAWSVQFDRIRTDLDAALQRQADVAVAGRTPEQATYLGNALAQFWDASRRIFDLAAAGRDAEARAQVEISLQARQAALSTAVARLLVQNNEAEAQTARQVQAIYGRVRRQSAWFLGAALLTIAATSLYLIRSNRRVFGEMAELSDDRRDLARKVIGARESTLREVSRELHDEFGQLLTAMGTMLRRVGRHVPAGSPLEGDLREIGETAQTALDHVRRLSQALHPSILDEMGLDSAVEWYLGGVGRQGIAVTFERRGTPLAVEPAVAIHVYRVLQEALTNVARHSGASTARVTLAYTRETVAVAPWPATLILTIEDDGRGMQTGAVRRGVGLVAMRERAALVGGTLIVDTSSGGGTRVEMHVPLAPPVEHA